MKDKLADADFLRGGECLETFPIDGKGNETSFFLYLFKHRNGKTYLLERMGVCDPKKFNCKQACCKLFSIQSDPIHPTKNIYYNYFSDMHNKTHSYIKRDCSMLGKDGKCKVWKKEGKFPNCCRQFPHPNDSIYLAVEKVCSFKFRIVGEFK